MKKRNIIITAILILILIGIIIIVKYNESQNRMQNENIDTSNYSNDNKTEDKTIEKVSIEIKEGTLTKTSATIIITDKNKEPYSYGEWFRIDKKENDKWKEVKIINDNYLFDMISWGVGENGTIERKIDWSELYGELENGEYRLVKKTSENSKYFSVEFNIQ